MPDVDLADYSPACLRCVILCQTRRWKIRRVGCIVVGLLLMVSGGFIVAGIGAATTHMALLVLGVAFGLLACAGLAAWSELLRRIIYSSDSDNASAPGIEMVVVDAVRVEQPDGSIETAVESPSSSPRLESSSAVGGRE